VLYHHEADAPTTAASVAFSEPENGSTPQTGAARCGAVPVPLHRATALWWCEPDATAVQIAVVSLSHDVPTMSSTLHVRVSTSRPFVDAFVTCAAHHGRSTLRVVTATHDGEINVTPCVLGRDDNAALYCDVLPSTLHTLSNASRVVAVADATGLSGHEELGVLVATPGSAHAVGFNTDGNIVESVLHEFDARDGRVVAAAFDAKGHAIIAATAGGTVVCVRLEMAGTSSVAATTSLGRGIVPRSIALEIDAAGAAVAALVHANDSQTHSECVIRVEADRLEVTDRISGMGGGRLAAMPVHVATGTAAFAWAHASTTRPLVAGVAGRVEGATTVHCRAFARGPIRIALSAPHAAFAVHSTSAGGSDTTSVFVAYGQSGRCRLYHATRGEQLRRYSSFAAAPSDDATFGRLSGIAPATVPVVESLPAASPVDAPTPPAVDVGAAVFDAATDGAEALRQLLATAVARASALPRSDAFQRVCADAACNGFFDDGAPTVTDEDLLSAVHNVLAIRSDAAASALVFDASVDGVCYRGNARAVAGFMLAELQRMLLELLATEVARVAQARVVASHVTTAIHRALAAVAAAFAVVRACDTRVGQLVAAVAEGESDALCGVTMTLRFLLRADAVTDATPFELGIVDVASFLKALPEPSVAMRATAAWTAAWLPMVPVMRHFVLCDAMQQGRTQANSRAVFDHMQATSSALGCLAGDVAAAIVLQVAHELHVDADNEDLFNVLYRDGCGDSQRYAMRAAGLYTVCTARALVVQGRMSSDDVHKVVPIVESFHRLADDAAAQPNSGAAEQLALEAFDGLLVQTHALLCHHAVLAGDIGGAVRCLQRLATIGDAPGAELAVMEGSARLVNALADAGRAGDLVHAMVSHPIVCAAVARHLHALVLDPRGVPSSERDEREERRVAMSVALFSFLVARGASATAARVAFDTATAMRSAPRRTERTLERALKVLSLAVNTVAVMPRDKPGATVGSDDDGDDDTALSSTRGFSDAAAGLRRETTTAFSSAGDAAVQAAGIGTLSSADYDDLRRRWKLLHCENLLVTAGASNPTCAPWAAPGGDAAPSDVEAAHDVAKALMRARMWRPALVLSEAWALSPLPVFRSYANDLLENATSDAEDWDALLEWVCARSTAENNHAPLQATVGFCLDHLKYKHTPARLKAALERHSAEAALATYLNRQRITGTVLDDALSLGERYCRAYASPSPDFAELGLSRGIISYTLLDRLHKAAVRCTAGSKGVPAETAALAQRFVAAFKLACAAPS